MTQLENRVVNYWAGRACDFGRVRERELHNELGRRWRAAILKQLPDRNNLKILDVGTGTGFFSILLSKEGHELTGIDLTPEMIGEAKRQAESSSISTPIMETPSAPARSSGHIQATVFPTDMTALQRICPEKTTESRCP